MDPTFSPTGTILSNSTVINILPQIFFCSQEQFQTPQKEKSELSEHSNYSPNRIFDQSCYFIKMALKIFKIQNTYLIEYNYVLYKYKYCLQLKNIEFMYIESFIYIYMK